MYLDLAPVVSAGEAVHAPRPTNNSPPEFLPRGSGGGWKGSEDDALPGQFLLGLQGPPETRVTAADLTFQQVSGEAERLN